MILVALCISLAILCITEFIALLMDRGIFGELVRAFYSMAYREGIWSAVSAAISAICGMINDLKAKCFHRVNRDNILYIAFSPSGGLGDYIISAKILEELLALCDCRIDVFCLNMDFADAIYGGRKNVTVKPYKSYERRRGSYDLGLSVEHFVHIKNINKKRLEKLSPELLERMEYIRKNAGCLYVRERHQWCRERLQFERCKILGLNRYTELRMGKAFAVVDMQIKIPLSEKYRKIWCKNPVSGNRYITINYGTDVMKKGSKQIKMWPKEYYEVLIDLVHQNMGDIKIYQLGDNEAEKIKGCDFYFFGEKLELVKWIIKDSRCHIDCEGGLVHLATQLATKCIVIFGPTPEHMYAYPQNVNLRGNCQYCMGLQPDWAYKCFKSLDKAECMYSVYPEIVMDNLKNILME